MSLRRILPGLLPRAPALAHRGSLAVLALPIAHSARPLSLSSVTRARASASPVSSIGAGRGTKAQKDQVKADKAAKATEREQKKKDKVTAKKAADKVRAQKVKDRAKAKKAAPKKKVAPKKKALVVVLASGKTRVRRSTIRAPKAPGTSWNVFLADFIAERRSANPGAVLPSVTLLTKEAAPLYHALSDYERQQLVARVAEYKERYPALLKEWKESLTPEMIKDENLLRFQRRKLGLSKKKNLRLEGEPKGVLTAYMVFNRELRADPNNAVLGGELNAIEQTKLLAAAWRALSPEERQVYEQASKADQERYRIEKQAFQERQASMFPPKARASQSVEA